MKFISDEKVSNKFENYPVTVRPQMEKLRELILETAESLSEIVLLEETLKWGEPSYLTKIGSTLRMDWKSKTPNHYALYFKCTSKLIPSIKEVYGGIFHYEGNRALLFGLDEELPIGALQECIKAALCYHKRKSLPNLGLKSAQIPSA